MDKFYFTFGSDPEYPFGFSEYVVVLADGWDEACDKFQNKYPSRPGSWLINCACIYTQKSWDRGIWTYYSGMEPSDIIA